MLKIGDVVHWSGHYQWDTKWASDESKRVIATVPGPFIVSAVHLPEIVEIKQLNGRAVRRAVESGDQDSWYYKFFRRDEFLTAVHRAKEAQTYEALDKSLT